MGIHCASTSIASWVRTLTVVGIHCAAAAHVSRHTRVSGPISMGGGQAAAAAHVSRHTRVSGPIAWDMPTAQGTRESQPGNELDVRRRHTRVPTQPNSTRHTRVYRQQLGPFPIQAKIPRVPTRQAATRHVPQQQRRQQETSLAAFLELRVSDTRLFCRHAPRVATRHVPRGRETSPAHETPRGRRRGSSVTRVQGHDTPME